MWFYIGQIFHVFRLHQEDAGFFACNLALGSEDAWKLWVVFPFSKTTDGPSIVPAMSKLQLLTKTFPFDNTLYLVGKKEIEELGGFVFLQRSGTMVYSTGALHEGAGEVCVVVSGGMWMMG